MNYILFLKYSRYSNTFTVDLSYINCYSKLDDEKHFCYFLKTVVVKQVSQHCFIVNNPIVDWLFYTLFCN